MSLQSSYTCINCASKVKELYKEYSPTVLKLATCSKCNLIADKYIEYDPIIIVIDLVLLNREAYRHVLFNTKYTFHWKLFVILELLEAYWELSVFQKWNKSDDPQKPVLLDKFYTGDWEFYNTLLKVVLRNVFSMVYVFLLTFAHGFFHKRKLVAKETVIGVSKCITLSSFGLFLFLPSLIWDRIGAEEYHLLFVVLYMTLSQLIAYTVYCGCSKIWSIFAILSSSVIKFIAYNLLRTHF